MKHLLRQRVSLLLALGIFLLLSAYQLDLPGLHYDEAKEAGLNAMQLLTGQPVTAFRDATLALGPVRLPLMVQDYIGALNVVLALPFLAVGGVNVVALRWLPLTIAALTLVMVWRAGLRLGGPVAAAGAALLLAVNPSFIFWSRQGIFVTNLTALIFMASLLTALRWWRGRRPADLWLTAFLWGLGLYAKLLFVWAVGAMAIVAVGASALEARSWKLEAGGWQPRVDTQRHRHPFAGASASTLALTLACFLLPLIPLIIFNIRTGGTLASIFGNLGRSYYGVDNSAYLANLTARLGQVVTLLRGNHFWYLGGVEGNLWAPWLLAGLILSALMAWAGARSCRPPAFLLPLALLALMVAQSAFTVSDLFIMHYAILLPLIPLAAGLALGVLWQNGDVGAIRLWSPRPERAQRRVPMHMALVILASLAALAWAGGDLWTTVRYHRALANSGGFATHSDAINRLAAYLDAAGYSAPVALDWGVDAPVRFLTEGRVAPVEVFGYGRLDAADDGFAGRVAPWLQDNNTVYVGHPPEKAVFRGRVEAMAELAASAGRLWLQEAWFSDRSGEVLFVIYRSIP